MKINLTIHWVWIIIQLGFIICKLCGIMKCSWFLVFLPTWIAIGIFLLIAIGITLIVIMSYFIK